MVEEEIAFVKVQSRGLGNCMVTIPRDVAKSFRIKKGQKMKVLCEKDKKRIIYQQVNP